MQLVGSEFQDRGSNVKRGPLVEEAQSHWTTREVPVTFLKWQTCRNGEQVSGAGDERGASVTVTVQQEGPWETLCLLTVLCWYPGCDAEPQSLWMLLSGGKMSQEPVESLHSISWE